MSKIIRAMVGAAALSAVVALAQPAGSTDAGVGRAGPGMSGGYGPGMMGGYGSGMMGGYGPGMMGGYGGYGPGMMGGYGPGMMGGYGSGMMGGYGGYGPGMMGGYGPGMMGGYGPGMMGGYGYGYHRGGPGMMGFGYRMQGALELTDDQRKKLDAIHDDIQGKHWDIVGKMRDEMNRMRELMVADPRDKAMITASYKRMSDLRQQRFELQLAAQDQMDALLTKEQRQKLKRWGPWWMGEGE
jgi:Spy/CpxP family protein refolding chaperone